MRLADIRRQNMALRLICQRQKTMLTEVTLMRDGVSERSCCSAEILSLAHIHL